MSRSVASAKTTKAGTPWALASSLRRARNPSNSSASPGPASMLSFSDSAASSFCVRFATGIMSLSPRKSTPLEAGVVLTTGNSSSVSTRKPLAIRKSIFARSERSLSSFIMP